MIQSKPPGHPAPGLRLQLDEDGSISFAEGRDNRMEAIAAQTHVEGFDMCVHPPR
ncbi:MAG: hypothetical protein RIT45_4046 [Pseudomonadota bacterium]|jgi:hypothetical protein